MRGWGSGGRTDKRDELKVAWLPEGRGAMMTEPTFLRALDRKRLSAVMVALRSKRGRLARLVFEGVPSSVDWERLGGAERVAWVVVAARAAGAEELASSVLASGLPVAWVTRWAAFPPPQLPLHDDKIFVHANCVAIGNVEGRATIVSGGSDCRVRMWDAATGAPVGAPLDCTADDDYYRVRSDEVYSVAIGHIDGRSVIVAGCGNTTAVVWDRLTEESPRRRRVWRSLSEGRAAVTIWPDDERVPPVIVRGGGFDNTIERMAAGSGGLLGGPIDCESRKAYSVAMGLIGDRRVIVSGHGAEFIDEEGADGEVRLWDAVTGSPIGEPLRGHTGAVLSVAIGEVDGRAIVVSASYDGTVRIWDPTTATPVGEPLRGHTARVEAVAIGRIDGRAVIVSGGADNKVRVWDAVTGAPIGPLRGHLTAEKSSHHNVVKSVAIGQVEDRAVIVSGGGDGMVRMWDTTADLPQGHLDEVLSLAPGVVNGRSVIISGGNDGTIRMWDATTGAPAGEPLGNGVGAVHSVAAGHTGDGHVRLVALSWGRARIWDAVSGALVAELPNQSVNRIAVGTVAGRSVIVTVSAVHDDADRTWKKGVQLWEMATGTPIGEPYFVPDRVTSLTVVEVGGRTMIVSGREDHSLRTWDAATGASIGEAMRGHTGSVVALAVKEVGGRLLLASGGADKTVRVWDLMTGTPVGDALHGHTATVTSVAFGEVGGGSAVVSGSRDDGTVRIWDAAGRSDRSGRSIDLGVPVTGVVPTGPDELAVSTAIGIIGLSLAEP
ncbi:WD40 repeat domain-containing protein [Nonomuraea guangzhouensis]|uniref:WD40 repeat domain-containing protein n=1 Tax=Nonomuraea guangzhouensis TaxID=1291555 RepID=A0ABW4G907_9ACTN|nr:WD40 repeat domain-containing protein [Nonomuraea guangzhouensis]